jgi:hypothetical protein
MPRILMRGEPRTERIAVLMTKKTRDALTKIALVQRFSVNTAINEAIAKYIEEHRDEIRRYNEFFGEE